MYGPEPSGLPETPGNVAQQSDREGFVLADDVDIPVPYSLPALLAESMSQSYARHSIPEASASAHFISLT